MTPNQRAPYERKAAEQRELERGMSGSGSVASSWSSTQSSIKRSSAENDIFGAYPPSTSSLTTSVTGLSDLSSTSAVRSRRDRTNAYIERVLRDRLMDNSYSLSSEKEALCAQKWYFIKFVTFCECDVKVDHYDPYYVLGEVGLIEYSLLDGIGIDYYHSFIKPNKIPLGYTSRCMDSQRDVHKIPLDSAENSKLVKGKTYGQIYKDIYEFVTRSSSSGGGSSGGRLPLLFCMSADVAETRFGLEFLWDKALEELKLDMPPLHDQISDLEWLVMALTDNSLSFVQSTELLTRYSFDYSANTRCEYHDEESVIHCALGIVKRKAYFISDHVCPLNNIQVTTAHLPVEPATGVVVDDEVIDFTSKFNQAACGGGRSGWANARGNNASWRSNNRGEIENDRPYKQAKSGYQQSFDIR